MEPACVPSCFSAWRGARFWECAGSAQVTLTAHGKVSLENFYEGESPCEISYCKLGNSSEIDRELAIALRAHSLRWGST